MNDPLRPSSLFGARVSAAAPTGVAATIPNPPADVARLAAGTILRGVVLGEDGQGHLVVRTELGTLAVATRAHLPAETEVILQVRTSGAQMHVLLMQSRGPPAPPAPLPGAAPDPRAAPPPPVASARGGPIEGLPAPGAGAAPDLLRLGQSVKAVLRAPAAAPEGAPGTQPAPGLPPSLGRLPPGSVLELRILSVSGPATAAGQPAPGPRPGGPVALGPGPGAANPAPAPAPWATGGPGARPPSGPAPPPLAPPPLAPPPLAPPPLAPPPLAPVGGGDFGGTPAPGSANAGSAGAGPTAPGSANVGSAGAGPTAPGSAGAPGGPAPGLGHPPSPAMVTAPGGAFRFEAQVSALSHAGRPVLHTPLGTLTLEVEAAWPPGARLGLELAPGARLGGPAVAPPEGGPARPAWPALEEALAVLRELGPGAGAPAVPEALPQPGPKLASGILFFLAALSGGDLGRWLGGPALQALHEAGREALVARLGREFAQMGRQAEGAGAEWRLVPIPLWDGHEVRQLRLLLRHRERRRGRAAEGGAGATRFILEVEMSRLGEMQLDGLVRAKRFDLILRTRRALPEAMRQDIRRIFHDANEATGTTGNLGFQASSDWRRVALDLQAAAAPSSLVV